MANRDTVWPQITQLLTADGGNDGTVQITSTVGFYTDQIVQLSSDAVETITLKVQDVVSATVLRLSPIERIKSGSGLNLSAYTQSDNAVISAAKQTKKIGGQNVLTNVYEADPTSAIRVMTVNQLGEYVEATGGGGGGGGGSSVSVTNNVSVTISTGNASFQFVKVLNTAITAGNANAGTALLAVTVTGQPRIITILNSLDSPIGITLNGTQIQEFEPGEGQSLDLASNSLRLNTSQTIGVFNVGNTSTTGSIRFQFVR